VRFGWIVKQSERILELRLAFRLRFSFLALQHCGVAATSITITGDNQLKKLTLTVASAILIIGYASGRAPAQDIANGNMPMHMDVNAMDTNHDGMISKEEFAAYGEKIWAAISHGKPTVPVNTAAVDFATGNMAMNAQDMDADHDGTISHEEFMAYGAKSFDKVKNPHGLLTLSDTTKYFSTGNMKP
jgi:EF hand